MQLGAQAGVKGREEVAEGRALGADPEHRRNHLLPGVAGTWGTGETN